MNNHFSQNAKLFIVSYRFFVKEGCCQMKVVSGPPDNKVYPRPRRVGHSNVRKRPSRRVSDNQRVCVCVPRARRR